MSQRIGAYEVVGPLGEGGMGIVVRARAPDGRDVAIKVLRSVTAASFTRFERELRVMRELGGEDVGLVPCVDAGTSDTGPFIVMPLVTGGTLAERLDRPPALTTDETVRLGRALAETLGRLHARGVVHRDLKPANVLFTADGRPLVADLGLAKFLDEAGSLSRTGELRGTFGYMASEQLLNAKSAGPPADVFALGCILYECLAGCPAHPSDGLGNPMSALERAAIPLSSLRPDLPAWLLKVVARALEPAPAARFQDGAELARALAPSVPGRRRSPPRRPRWGLRVGVLSTVVAACLIAFAALKGGDERASVPTLAPVATSVPVPTSEPVPTPLPPAPVQPEDPAPATPVTLRLSRRAAYGTHNGKHEAMLVQVAFSPDGRLGASVGLDGALKLWDLETGEERGGLQVQVSLSAVSFLPDGGLLVGGDGGLVFSPSRDGGRPARRFEGLKDRVYGVLPMGGLVYGLDAQGTLACWDPSGQVRWRRDGAGAGMGASAGVLVTVGDLLYSWDPLTGEPRGRSADPVALASGFALSPDGRKVAIAHQRSAMVSVWDVATLTCVRSFRAFSAAENRGQGDARSPAFTPDGARLITCGDDEVVRVWDLDDGELLDQLRGHTGWTMASAISADGRRLLTGSNDATVRLWDLPEGRERWPLVGHASTVTGVAWARERVVSGSIDRTVRLWATDGAEERVALPGWVSDVSASEGGAWLAMNCGGQLVAVRDLVRGTTELSPRSDPITCQWIGDDGGLLVGDAQGRLHGAQGAVAVHRAAVLAVARRDEFVLTVGADGGVARVTLDDLRVEEVAHADVPLTGAAVSRDFEHVAALDAQGRVRVLDVATGTWQRCRDAGGAPVIRMAIASDGAWVVTGEADRALRVWGAPGAGEALDVVDLSAGGESPRSVSIAPGDAAVAVGTSRSMVLVFDVVLR